MDDLFKRLENTPPHLFRPHAIYFVTAKTLAGQHYLTGSRPQEVIDSLRFACGKHGWELLAWVVLINHYHCLLQAPEDAASLSKVERSVHRFTSTNWNVEDAAPGRQVWYRYRDTCITNDRSFFARVNYIHLNPVKHRLVSQPEDYPFSSYRLWSERTDVDALEREYPCDLLDLED